MSVRIAVQSIVYVCYDCCAEYCVLLLGLLCRVLCMSARISVQSIVYVC